MSALDELRESLREAARRDVEADRVRNRRRRRRATGFVALALLGGAAAAGAADLISVGEPVREPAAAAPSLPPGEGGDAPADRADGAARAASCRSASSSTPPATASAARSPASGPRRAARAASRAASSGRYDSDRSRRVPRRHEAVPRRDRARRPHAASTAAPQPATRTVSVPRATDAGPGRPGRRVPVRLRRAAATAASTIRRGIERPRVTSCPARWPTRSCSAAASAVSTAAMMLARDGHDVTVLERDPRPGSRRPRGRLGALAPRRRRAVPPGPLPAAARAPGARRRAARRAPRARGRGRAALQPARRDAARRSRTVRRGPGDERFVTWTARRSTLEQAIGRAAEAEPALDVRRGVAVAALETRRLDGRCTSPACAPRAASGSPPTSSSTRWAAARRCRSCSRRPAAIRCTRRPRTAASSTTRASSAATLPELRGPPLNCRGRLVLDPDPARRRGHVVAHALRLRARPRRSRRLRDPARWTALVRACPRHAHWLDGEPITGVMPMGGVLDRYAPRRHRRRPASAAASATRGRARTRRSGRGDLARPGARRAAAPRRARARRAPGGADDALHRRRPSASCRRGTARPSPSTARGWREIEALRTGAAPPPPVDPVRAALPRGDDPRPGRLPRRAGHHRAASRCRRRSSRGRASPSGCSSTPATGRRRRSARTASRCSRCWPDLEQRRGQRPVVLGRLGPWPSGCRQT